MIPQEQNDRLLELAGGCRHGWGDFSDDGITRYFCKRQGCNASHYWTDPPAVGDGHQMTLGEMVRLAAKLWPDAEITMNHHDGYAVRDAVHKAWWDVDLCPHDGRDFLGVGESEDIELALAAAILAAVDGVK